MKFIHAFTFQVAICYCWSQKSRITGGFAKISKSGRTSTQEKGGARWIVFKMSMIVSHVPCLHSKLNARPSLPGHVRQLAPPFTAKCNHVPPRVKVLAQKDESKKSGASKVIESLGEATGLGDGLGPIGLTYSASTKQVLGPQGRFCAGCVATCVNDMLHCFYASRWSYILFNC